MINGKIVKQIPLSRKKIVLVKIIDFYDVCKAKKLI